MNAPDVFRTLDCWLWRVDPSTQRVVTVGGTSPFGSTATSWRSLLRQCALDDRHAVLDALRLLGSSDEDGTLRVESLAIPVANGHGHLVDLLVGRRRDSAGAPGWTGMVSRRWPSARGQTLVAASPGNELVGVIEALAGPSVHSSQRAAPAGTAAVTPSSAAPPTAVPSRGDNTGLNRESLVREIHHRIKNHLQGMTGLIERYRNDYPGMGDALDAIGGQLHSIGTVYGLLARSGHRDLALDEIAQAVTDGLAGIAPNGVKTRFPDDMGSWRISEQHCVAIALVVNELLMNAIKHGDSRSGMPAVTVDCEGLPQGCTLNIRNAGTLPPGFDLDAGTGARTGLQLVRAMLPARGAKLSICAVQGTVEVSLVLEPPVLSASTGPTGALSHG